MPIFRALWEEHYAPWGRLHLRKSWKRVKHGHGAHLLAFLGDLPWDHITHARLDEYCALRLSRRPSRVDGT